MTLSAVIALHVAFWLGIYACLRQTKVTWENQKDLRAVKQGKINGNLLRIARWDAFISPLVLGLFLFMTFLAYFGIQAGPPNQVTTFGLAIRWSYTVIMAVDLLWAEGALRVRRGLQ